MKIIIEELQFEESLKQRLEFICEFAKVTTTFKNGSIRKIENTNLSKKIKLSELEEYLKKIIFSFSKGFLPLKILILSMFKAYQCKNGKNLKKILNLKINYSKIITDKK